MQSQHSTLIIEAAGTHALMGDETGSRCLLYPGFAEANKQSKEVDLARGGEVGKIGEHRWFMHPALAMLKLPSRMRLG